MIKLVYYNPLKDELFVFYKCEIYFLDLQKNNWFYIGEL